MFRRLVLGLALIFAGCAVAAAQEMVTPSYWQNQRGSLLAITSVSGTSFNGYYINRAAGFGCQNTQYPVVGYASGATVNFVVTWNNSSQNCLSVTAWKGTLNGATITSNWQLAAGQPNTGTVTTTTGNDTFNRIAEKDIVKK